MKLDVTIEDFPFKLGLYASNNATSTQRTVTLIIGHLMFHKIHDGGPTEGEGGWMRKGDDEIHDGGPHWIEVIKGVGRDERGIVDE